MPFQFPYELGTSRQGAPVRVRHNTPLIIWRWSHQRPPRRGVRSGSSGSNRAHSPSVKSWRSCTGDAYRTRASRSERHALVGERHVGDDAEGVEGIDAAVGDRAQMRPVVAEVEGVGELLVGLETGEPDAVAGQGSLGLFVPLDRPTSLVSPSSNR